MDVMRNPLLYIEKRANEMLKQAMQFDTDLFSERCALKRKIKRKEDHSTLCEVAAKCIRLTYKRDIYNDISRRLVLMGHEVLEYYKELIEVDEFEYDEYLINSLRDIEKSLTVMNFDLLEQQLDTFELDYGVNQDNITGLEQPYTIMFKEIPVELQTLYLVELEKEVKEEEKSFMFEKPNYSQNIVINDGDKSCNIFEKPGSEPNFMEKVQEERKSEEKPDSIHNFLDSVNKEDEPFVMKKPDSHPVSEEIKDKERAFMFKKPEPVENVKTTN
uniref:Uncharacterized protein n=1 Tax=Cuerna arida TaxID=1464854 RepID=A0A1B6GXU7_9HEMI